MKKVFILLMALGFFAASCNNNKNGKGPINREKDDYGKMDDQKTGDENTGNSGWSESDKSSALKECIGGFEEGQTALANQICPCVLGKLEKEYPSFKAANATGNEAAVQRIALQCKEEIVGNSDNNNNTGNTWSKSDDDQWMQVCATPLVGSVGQEKANNYCNCILGKLKQRFSSFNEMNTKGSSELGKELGLQCKNELIDEQ